MLPPIWPNQMKHPSVESIGRLNEATFKESLRTLANAGFMDLEGLTKKTDFQTINPVKLDLENGLLKFDFWLTSELYCQFGQVNLFDQLNGIARIMTVSG